MAFSSASSRSYASCARAPVGNLPSCTQSDTVRRSRSNNLAASATVRAADVMATRSRNVKSSILPLCRQAERCCQRRLHACPGRRRCLRTEGLRCTIRHRAAGLTTLVFLHEPRRLLLHRRRGRSGWCLHELWGRCELWGSLRSGPGSPRLPCPDRGLLFRLGR